LKDFALYGLKEEALHVFYNILNIAEQHQEGLFIFTTLKDIGEESSNVKVQVLFYPKAFAKRFDDLNY
jgi:hypothetical protein